MPASQGLPEPGAQSAAAPVFVFEGRWAGCQRPAHTCPLRSAPAGLPPAPAPGYSRVLANSRRRKACLAPRRAASHARGAQRLRLGTRGWDRIPSQLWGFGLPGLLPARGGAWWEEAEVSGLPLPPYCLPQRLANSLPAGAWHWFPSPLPIHPTIPTAQTMGPEGLEGLKLGPQRGVGESWLIVTPRGQGLGVEPKLRGPKQATKTSFLFCCYLPLLDPWGERDPLRPAKRGCVCVCRRGCVRRPV